MELKEKIELIKLLTELNGIMIVNKLEGKDIKKNFERVKVVAKKLSEEGIGNFDFTSEEKFEKSVNDFLSDFD